MDPKSIICLVIGFTQGIFSLPSFRMLVGGLTRGTSEVIGDEVGRPIASIIAVCAFVFSVVIHFGVAIPWILLLALPDQELLKLLARSWGQGWFLGLLSLFGLAMITRRRNK
jgi:hypothetical protein